MRALAFQSSGMFFSRQSLLFSTAITPRLALRPSRCRWRATGNNDSFYGWTQHFERVDSPYFGFIGGSFFGLLKGNSMSYT